MVSDNQTWRQVWREGLSPLLSTDSLLALKKALEEDDPQLLQGVTTEPPPLTCVQDWPVEGACLIGLCGWKGDGLTTVGEVEEFFARACYESDRRMGEPAAVRHLLGWFDETPRDQMRRELLAEVNAALSTRE